MSVNVSGRQFNTANMEESFRNIILRSGIHPALLTLEITESLLMSRPDHTRAILQNFSNAGISLAIDDFGTGYSSLSYLRSFPIHTLKIDRSFVRDVNIDSEDAALVSAIIAMAKSMHLTVVAEGVETEEQHDFLKSLDCETAQGFLYYRPIPPEEITTLLQTDRLHRGKNPFDS